MSYARGVAVAMGDLTVPDEREAGHAAQGVSAAAAQAGRGAAGTFGIFFALALGYYVSRSLVPDDPKIPKRKRR